MARLHSVRRPGARIKLRVHNPDEPGSSGPKDPFVHWAVAAVCAGVASAFAGWVLVAAIATIGWLSAQSSALGDAIRVGTHGWLLANGAGLSLAGQRWTLIPLGLTLVLLAILNGLTALAVRQGLQALAVDESNADPDDPDGIGHAARRRLVRNVTLLSMAAYAGSVTLSASLAGTANQGARALVGSVIIGLLGAYSGASRAADLRLDANWPAWLRAVPRAVVGAVAVLVASGAFALAIALISKAERIDQLSQAIGLNAASGSVVLLVELLFLPNLVLWSGSWVLGAGFRIGQSSLISPSATNFGVLPSIPILGALPDEGSGTNLALLWLLCGVLAGAVAAILVMRARPRARFDETALVGGLSGVLAGLAYTALALASRGDLGTGVLTGLGPRPLELAVMSAVVLGLSGMATGLIWGLVRRPADD